MLYWHAQSWPNADTWTHTLCHWAKLQLPNGQKVCSVWNDTNLMMKLRRSLCIKVSTTNIYILYALIAFIQITYGNKIHIANVLYYFCLHFGNSQYPLAMVELFSELDEDIL